MAPSCCFRSRFTSTEASYLNVVIYAVQGGWGAMFTRATMAVSSLPPETCSRNVNHSHINRVSTPALIGCTCPKRREHGTLLFSDTKHSCLVWPQVVLRLLFRRRSMGSLHRCSPPHQVALVLHCRYSNCTKRSI